MAAAFIPFRVAECAFLLASVQKARKAGDVPEDLHEVAAAAPEAAAARHLEGEGVWLRPGGASAQLRARR